MTPAAIKQPQEDLRLSRRKLAQQLGVHHSSVRFWELGVCSPPPKAGVRLAKLKREVE